MNVIRNAVFALAASVTGAMAQGWTDLADMNKQIAQTNFIIGNHCSGTLISVEYKLILTNHHCIDQYAKTETKQFIGEGGEIINKKIETLKSVPVSQNSYYDYEVVSSSSWTTDIIGYDKDVDLAVIQIRADSIPHTYEARIFNKGTLLLGQPVYAVGNPRMLDLSVSKGVISSLNRKIKIGGNEIPYFQMDARIAGGSSGGSLYTEDGILIGVPGAASRDGSVMLAIPYKEILKFLDYLCLTDVYSDGAGAEDHCLLDEDGNPLEEEAE